MKSAGPLLLPLLRSRAQGDITAWIMLHAEQSFPLTEIADAVGVSAATVMREVNRLADAGLVLEVRRGNTRLVQANTDNVAFAPLAHLMAVTFGPIPVLSEHFSALSGIREAYIYGSWAARYTEVPGPVPDDIDVLLIGDTDLDDLDDVASQAGRRLGREVNIRRVRPTAWDSAREDPFKTTVMSRPVVTLVGGEPG